MVFIFFIFIYLFFLWWENAAAVAPTVHDTVYIRLK